MSWTKIFENPARSRGSVQYVVDLSTPHETITLFRGPRNELLARLSRFGGASLATFKPSKDQLTKIDRRAGKIHVTDEQIAKAALIMSPMGRAENPLVTSTNSRAAEKAVRSAAAHRFGRGKKWVFYEHDQWWVELPNGAQYSAVDTSRGIDFEQVSEGEDW